MMKKICLLALCLALALYGTAFAEEKIFDTLAGLEWSFSSGVGGWSTDMRIHADGTFTGEYHDSEMGEAAESYPDGTVYFCAFAGKMSAEQVDGSTWRIRVEKLEKEQGKEVIEDGIRYVPADVYGLSEGDEMLLYCPGTSVKALSEEMQLWAHVIDQETPPTELEDWFLMSEKNDSGFVGYPSAGMANPWQDVTAEQLKTISGASFSLPEGAENAVWRYLESEKLAEMQFEYEGDHFCARTKPTAEEDSQPEDITGMYYTWTDEEPVSVGQCSAVLRQAKDGEGLVEVCLWYDAAQGKTCSLSVKAMDPDGLDLATVAEQVFTQ